jgi:uncharacterized membrane protein
VQRSSTKRAAGGLSVAAILLATVVTLSVGAVIKSRCASGDWADGRQYRQLCYSDIVPLYLTEHLSGGRLPYLDPCPVSAGLQCDEYPVLTMYFMRATASLANWTGKSFSAFFFWNAVLLGLCGLAVAWALHRTVGDRALYFAVAPTLAIYAFVNWDLLAVALAALATLAYVRDRDGPSGALLGLGAAAKAYPALLLVPFVLERIRQRRGGGATSLVVWAAIAYAAVNLPFALAARHQWERFFLFNSRRPPDWDSMWFVACNRIQGSTGCSWSAHLVNWLSLAAFAVVAVLVWWVRRSRQPDFPRWTFGFPLLVAFLLTNKVYSPQYSLWLLPWFALALPNPWLFATFEAADVAVFVTRFSWFGRLSHDLGQLAFSGYRGVPIGAFQVALVIRAAVLVVCLGAWALGKEKERQRGGPLLLEPSLSGAGP